MVRGSDRNYTSRRVRVQDYYFYGEGTPEMSAQETAGLLDNNMIRAMLYSSSQKYNLSMITCLSRMSYGLSSSYSMITKNIQDKKEEIKRCMEYLSQHHYVAFHTGDVIHAVRMNAESTFIHSHVFIDIEDTTISFTTHGDDDDLRVVSSWIHENFENEKVKLLVAKRIDRDGDVVTTRESASDGENLALQSFYPWLSVPLSEYFETYMKAKESVLILFGPPGTGKSTFIRTLINHGNYGCMLAYNKEVVNSPDLLDTFYNDKDLKILAYEDTDKYLGSREDGNDLMSSILNVADGVVCRSGRKIVFSTNLPSIDSIDPALLRYGRCFDILEFRELTSDEAPVVISDLGREPRDFSTKKWWSLAEILNERTRAVQTINRFTRKPGFRI